MATSKTPKNPSGSKKPSKGSSSSRTKTESSTSVRRTRETSGTNVGDSVKAEETKAPTVSTVTPSDIGPVKDVESTKIDTTGSDEWRQSQRDLAKNIEDTVYGRAPSIADKQFQKATEQNVAQQFGLARSQRGSANPALAMRNAQMQASQIGQTAALDSAIAGIQEQRSAQNMLNQLYGTSRAQDIGLATSQAEITNRESLANALAENERMRRQAELNQSAGIFNAGASNTAGNLVYQTDAQRAQAYADAVNQRRLQQANINSQLAQQRMSSGATLGAARMGAGASNYATDAGLYKFNMENMLQLDQQGYANRYNEANAENTRNQGRGDGLRAGIAQAGQGATAYGASGGGGGSGASAANAVRASRGR